jgi:hypothetical protein
MKSVFKKSSPSKHPVRAQHKRTESALSRRLTEMWRKWDEDTIKLLDRTGFPDADLITLIGRPQNPPGADLGSLWHEAYRTAQRRIKAIKELLAGMDAEADRAKIVRAVEQYGEARERLGHLGAQFELLAADHLANESRLSEVANAKRQRTQERLEAIRAYIAKNPMGSSRAQYVKNHREKMARELRARDLVLPGSDTALEKEIGKALRSKPAE